MQEIPVYILTGFMDSGKTTMILDTLVNNGFAEDMDSVLILSCEDGDVEYTQEDLDKIHGKVVYFEEED
jgi:G3E family GTPase